MSQAVDWFSITRMLGLVAYLCSLTACGIAFSSRTRRDARATAQWKRLYRTLALLQAILLLDVAFDWRWKLHDYAVRAATADGVYGLRRSPQALALGILAAIAIFAVFLILWRYRKRPGAVLALSSASLSAILWCVEVLSYHPLDRILYHRIGPAMFIGFVWICLAIVFCFGVWIESRTGNQRLQKVWQV